MKISLSAIFRKNRLLPAFLLMIQTSLFGQADPYAFFRLRMIESVTWNEMDSLRFYAEKQLRFTRATDSLAAWAWAINAAAEQCQKNADALYCLNIGHQYRWREPRDTAELKILIFNEIARGWYSKEEGQVWQSVQAYEEARYWYERSRFSEFNLDALEELYKPLGNQYTRLGDNEKALFILHKALNVKPPAPADALAGLYGNIGTAYWNMGDYVEAERACKQGLALSPISAGKRALLLGALAMIHLDAGRPDKALDQARSALQLLSHVPASDHQLVECRFRANRTAGMASLSLGRHREAGRLLDAARKDALLAFPPSNREIGKTELLRAALFRSIDQPRQALEIAQSVLVAMLPGFQPRYWSDNPDPQLFYEENTLFEALNEKALAAENLYGKTGELDLLRLALRCHDLAWQCEQRLRTTYQYQSAKLGLQGAARAREEAAMTIAWTLYERTGLEEYLDQGFAIAERSKSAILREALQESLLRAQAATSDERFIKLNALRRAFAFFQKNLLLQPDDPQAPAWRSEADGLQTQIVALERTLAVEHPLLGPQAADESSAWAGLLSLGEKEWLLAYFLDAHWVYVFVANRQGTKFWQRFPNDEAFQDLLRQYLSYFENAGKMLNDPGGYLRVAYALGQRLLPAEIAGAPALLVVADGGLQYVPFEALLTAAPVPATNLRNAPYLLRRQSVRYAWSLGTLRQQAALHFSGENKGYLLGIAPGFANNSRGLAPLTESQGEWSAIPAARVKALLGQAANTQAVTDSIGYFQMIHFATHAFGSPTGKRQPRIELYDQPLLLPELYVLPLHADLVVLSACQTGLGADQRGEGVMSIARAIGQAGAASIVSSLWAVNDRSTRRLFGYFYENMQEERSVGDALRDAKLRYLDDRTVNTSQQTPYHWGAFVLVGDDRVVAAAPEQQSHWNGWISILLGAFAMLVWLVSADTVRRERKQVARRRRHRMV